MPLLEKHTTRDVEIGDEVGRTAQDSSRRIPHVLMKEAVAPAPPPEPAKPKARVPNMGDYDMHIDEQTDEAVLIHCLAVTAVSLSTGERRTGLRHPCRKSPS